MSTESAKEYLSIYWGVNMPNLIQYTNAAAAVGNVSLATITRESPDTDRTSLVVSGTADQLLAFDALVRALLSAALSGDAPG